MQNYICDKRAKSGIMGEKEADTLMPNKTFDNLSDEKKEAVIEAALKEFTVHDFDSASLNDIITEIGIAKGSFYRYFNNKKDLYDYLIAYGLEKKFNYVSKIINSADDLFDFILNITSSYIKFSIENIPLAAFMLKASLSDPVVRDSYLFLKDGKKVLMDKIISSQQKGVLSSRFSVDFIYFCIMELLLESSNYIKENYFGGKKFQEHLPKTLPENQKIDHDIRDFYQQLVLFLKNGFCQ
jgi:AcrR family transcriptional regulator